MTTPQHPEAVNEERIFNQMKKCIGVLEAEDEHKNIDEVFAIQELKDVIAQELTLAEQRGYDKRVKESNSGKLMYQRGLEDGDQRGREAERSKFKDMFKWLERWFDDYAEQTESICFTCGDYTVESDSDEQGSWMYCKNEDSPDSTHDIRSPYYEMKGMVEEFRELITPSDGADTKGKTR